MVGVPVQDFLIVRLSFGLMKETLATEDRKGK